MDTQEISFLLSKIDPKLMLNVFAANRIPMFDELPIFLVSNLDPDTKKGSHWIAIHIDKYGVGEYFDSYGRKPIGYHLDFLKRNAKKWIFNDKRIQNNFTSICGEYCLIYLYFKYMNKSMHNFVNIFTTNTLYNDLLLRNMFKIIFLND